jgi:hypothetical protein
MKSFKFILLLFMLSGFSIHANAFNKTIGKGYCTLRHPIEALTSDSVTCESQHVVQQQAGGGDEANTIWINKTLHTYLDRSSCKPWESERPAFAPLSDDNIQRAYMTGVWANGYHFFMYDHHEKGTLTITEWDGATHFLYLITTIVNLPQKEVNYLAYQIERYRKDQQTQFIDAGIGLIVDVAEVAVGTIYSVTGMVVGTLLNPWDTLRNIPSLITLAISSVFNAIWLFLKGVLAIITAGSFGSCGL